MGKQHRDDDDMINERLDSLDNQHQYLKEQLSYIIRLISGDETLNKLRPTGMIHELKEVKEKLEEIDKDSRAVVSWFNERGKRKFIINIDLVQWGKVIAWIVATVAGIIGLIRWINSVGK